jgi:hypothetical protein
MTSKGAIYDDIARALRPGELRPAGVEPLSLARWMFWRSKLEEAYKGHGVGADERLRYAEAIGYMAVAGRKGQ